MYRLMGSNQNRSLRVHWALTEMEIPYESIPGGPRSDEARAANPTAKVPILFDGDDVVTDSVAIIQYLADKHDKLTYPAGTIERAKQDSFTQFACDEMDAVLWTAGRHSFVLPEEKRVPEIKAPLRWEFARSMKALEQRMGDGPFLMGEKMTVADIITAHCGRWARRANFEFEAPKVDAYLDRMLNRPAFLELTKES